MEARLLGLVAGDVHDRIGQIRKSAPPPPISTLPHEASQLFDPGEDVL